MAEKEEVEEGNLSLEGPVSSSSLLNLSVHHNGRRERLKAIDKDAQFVERKEGGDRERRTAGGEFGFFTSIMLNLLQLNISLLTVDHLC